MKVNRDVAREMRIAAMLAVMDEVEELDRACQRMGLTFKSEVLFFYRCERCGVEFDDADDCAEHEETCLGQVHVDDGPQAGGLPA